MKPYTLGRSKRRNPVGKVILFSLVIGGIAGGGYWLKHRPLPRSAGDTQTLRTVRPEQTIATLTPLPSSEVLKKKEALSPIRVASISLTGPLERAVIDAVGPQMGPALTQVLTRLLVWWIHIPGDLKRSDKIEVLYEERPGEEPLVHALKYQSEKTGKIHQAYRFKPSRSAFFRYYVPGGEELELRLKNGPLDNYEQITSLLKDGRRHKGVDFKTPVGTPVKATFSGTVTRKTWHFRANGNSLETTETASPHRRTLFLHLSEIAKGIGVGTQISQGQIIGATGNTGHSFAPHLHYQMMSAGDKVIDPFDNHLTYRSALPAEERAGFEAETRRLNLLMSPSPLAGK